MKLAFIFFGLLMFQFSIDNDIIVSSSKETKIQRAIQCNANQRGGSTINWVKISTEEKLGDYTSVTGTFSASSLIDYNGDFVASFDFYGNLISLKFKSTFESDWMRVREDCFGSSTNKEDSELNGMVTNELLLDLQNKVRRGIQCNASRRGGSKIKSAKIKDYNLLSSGRLEFSGIFEASNFLSYTGQFKSSVNVLSGEILYMKFISTYESSWVDIDSDCY
jgi:hypothetical protein